MKKNTLNTINKIINSEKSLILDSFDRVLKTIDLIGLEYGYSSVEFESAIQRVIEVVPTHKVSQRHIVNYMKCEPFYSHVSSQIEYMRFKQHLEELGLVISPWVNDKSIDQKFVNSLGIPTPKIIQTKVKLKDINFQNDTVLKPFTGSTSRHVFYVYNKNNIVEITTNTTYDSIEALKSNLNSRNIEDLWQVETLIYGNDKKPAHDIKVYCYYGEVGCILEVKREEQIYRCWYGSNGELLPKEESSKIWFEGSGFDSRVIQYAKTISLAIPAPFMRVDFYKGKSDYYLGELTPHPGRYFPEYSSDLDSQLGRLFKKAEARLFKDLIQSKQFSEYFKYYNYP